MKRVILSHPTGNATVRGAVAGLNRVGALHSLHTSVACFEGTPLHSLSLCVAAMRDFLRREYDSYLRKKVYQYPFWELCRLLSRRLRIRPLERALLMRTFSSVDYGVARFVISHADEFDAIYCYEDCALESFEVAGLLKKTRIYELPIGHWRAMRQMLEDQRHLHPEWAVTMGGFEDSKEKLYCKDRELELADKIYVASTFTKQTLECSPLKLCDIEVIPYGFPPVRRNRIYVPAEGRLLRLLFVGGLSQRKGLANIFEAMEQLGDVAELTVIGRGDIAGCAALRRALAKVNYIESLPHSDVLDIMASHDLLLFPSLFEGFGLVITEAMSQGTPVITTARTVAPDIITHGVNGWIVEAGSTESLLSQIRDIVDNPTVIESVGRAAMYTASQRPWSRYETELAESVVKFLDDE